MFAALASGCAGLGYYAQAARGQAQVLLARRPIERVLAEPSLPAETRAQLELVQSLRAFARDALQLPVGRRYASFARLPRTHVVWNVFAAPEFSLDLHRWCYPIVGCVVYRGYFREAAARQAAAALAQQGFDTTVGGVRAYSTLGWFDDPVLSTFVDAPGAELAALIFHELAHSVAFAPGDSDFNEGFATFVEGLGVERWLGDGDALTAWRGDHAVQQALYRFIDRWRAALADLYAQPLAADAMRRRKAEVLSAMRADYRAQPLLAGRYDGFFDAGLNNARLSSVSTYHARGDAFAALFAHCGGDLPRFYDAARELARGPQALRQERLDALAAGSTGAPAAAAGCGCPVAPAAGAGAERACAGAGTPGDEDAQAGRPAGAGDDAPRALRAAAEAGAAGGLPVAPDVATQAVAR